MAQGHAHWVNTLALSSEYALRTGPYDHTGKLKFASEDTGKAKEVASLPVNLGHLNLILCPDVPFRDLRGASFRTGPGFHLPSPLFSPLSRKGCFLAVYLVMSLFSQAARKRYDEARAGKPERLVSGSDDFTMFLWEPSTSKTSMARMTGHVQLINQVGANGGDTSILCFCERLQGGCDGKM